MPLTNRSLMSSTHQDELTSTVFDAMHALPPARKANFLLDMSLTMIEAGECVHTWGTLRFTYPSICRYGSEVENYLEVYLRTPNLPNEDVAKALLARGNARKATGEKLLIKAQQGVQMCTSCASLANNCRLPSRVQTRPLKPGDTVSNSEGQAGTICAIYSAYVQLISCAADTLPERTGFATCTARSMGNDRTIYTAAPPANMAVRLCIPPQHCCADNIPHARPLFR